MLKLLAFIFLITGVISMKKIYDNPPGYCNKDNQYYQDVQIIYWAIALLDSEIKDYKQKKYTPEKYLEDHPDCCRLNRYKASYLSRILSFKNNTFDVTVKFEIANRNKPTYYKAYFEFDPCGKMIEYKTIVN